VSREDAWDYVAGLTIGQDLSEREGQNAGAKPQYSLAKSHTGFGPMGPWLVSVDEFENPNDLGISSTLSGEVMQSSRTSMMIYSVADLIVELSSVCELYPGDVIFSGTPAGVGNARTPKRFIGPTDTLHSEIEGIGFIDQTFRAR
jgi:2-keto-4-pentenoate hydratase/2-oxohepta-3-ene-1,7-dioic acid hydratase in catechol pathway